MIRVLLVDDHAILREGLKSFLKYYDDIEVVGEAASGLEAIHLVELTSPDIVLMDIAMPEMNGLVATRRIREQFPTVKVLILTQYEDQQYVIPLLQAGASGYVLKRAFGTDLIKAIRSVAEGENFLYPAVLKTVLDQIRVSQEPGIEGKSILSAREEEILQKVALGETSRKIAYDLNISVKTVEWHRANIMKKLHLHSVAELASYVVKNGLLG